MSLAQSLEVAQGELPPFVLPVLRCGERSGRLDQSLRYLERHCAMLEGPSRMMRNTWLAPLTILAAGSVILTVAHALLASPGAALRFAFHEITQYATAGVAAWFFFCTPQGGKLMDHVRLALPVLGPVERDLALNRFFHALGMLYSTSGIRVEAMIREAAESVDNRVARADVLRADRLELR